MQNLKSELSRRAWLGVSALSGLALGAGCTPAIGATDAAPINPLPSRTTPARVAILIDDQATVIDFAGPWETFQDGGFSGAQGFELFTVAPSADVVRASAGLQIKPDYTLANAPQPDVIVIGAQSGGRTDSMATDAKVEWIKHAQAGADVVMSVCTGAFLLARTGLLDGLDATTHHLFYDQFAQQFPRVNLVRGRRFVDNGKFMSAGGLTSGVSGALHVVARFYGMEAARASADYMEHHDDSWISGVQNAGQPA